MGIFSEYDKQKSALAKLLGSFTKNGILEKDIIHKQTNLKKGLPLINVAKDALESIANKLHETSDLRFRKAGLQLEALYIPVLKTIMTKNPETGHYYSTIPDFREGSVLDIDELYDVCNTTCRDRPGSLYCEFCKGSDAGKLMGSLVLSDTTCEASQKTCLKNLPYNVIYTTIKEIIISIAYYSGINKDQKTLYDKLVLDNDTVTSIYSVCKSCKPPFSCQRTGSDIERRICQHDGVLDEVFSNQTRKEMFYIGYDILTTKKWTKASILVSMLDKLSVFVSKRSLVETLVELADIVIENKAVEWKTLSTIYLIFVSMKENQSTSIYNFIMKKLNTMIDVYGIQVQF